MPNDAAPAIAIPLDDAGNPISLINVVTICPAEYIDAARTLGLELMGEVIGSGDTDAAKLLPDALSPTGTSPATHYICARVVNPKEEQLQADWEAQKKSVGVSWFHGIPFEIPGSPDRMKSKLGHYVGDTDEFLQFLGLRRIRQ